MSLIFNAMNMIQIKKKLKVVSGNGIGIGIGRKKETCIYLVGIT